jgi:phosphoribosylanthranilate isomerase
MLFARGKAVGPPAVVASLGAAEGQGFGADLVSGEEQSVVPPSAQSRQAALPPANPVCGPAEAGPPARQLPPKPAPEGMNPGAAAIPAGGPKGAAEGQGFGADLVSGDSPPAQVKVCGLTVVDEAVACAEQGADAIGLVFYPPSPRFVSVQRAREISMSLPEKVWKIGVFVEEPFAEIMKKAEFCRLNCIQLHGSEPPETVEALELAGIKVIKSLFVGKRPHLSEIALYRAWAYLIESGEGPVPGGAGLSWKWGAAAHLAGNRPCILAGGLSPENVGEAIYQFGPDAVDVSSGVESDPARKDIDKVRAFIKAVRNAKPNLSSRGDIQFPPFLKGGRGDFTGRRRIFT